MSDQQITYMDPAEFRRLGYLQELNRLFLHPLGLALEVDVDLETGETRLGNIWDCRDDPEGLWFGGEFPPGAMEKAERILEELSVRLPARLEKLGFAIEPIPEGG